VTLRISEKRIQCAKAVFRLRYQFLIRAQLNSSLKCPSRSSAFYGYKGVLSEVRLQWFVSLCSRKEIVLWAIVLLFSTFINTLLRPPLWSSGQSFRLQIPTSRVRFRTLPHFLRSRGSGTGSTQPREDTWGATWMKKYRLGSIKPRLTAVGIRCADHAISSIRKSWH
jgi:hypothetical protein